jgi:hypothetical protein
VGLNRHMSVQAVWRGAWPTRGEPLAIVLPGRAQPVHPKAAARTDDCERGIPCSCERREGMSRARFTLKQ